MDGRPVSGYEQRGHDEDERAGPLIEPLRNVYGISDKVLAMALSGILIDAGDVRPRWLEVGVPLIAVDTLVHHFLQPNRYLEPAQSRPFVRPRLLPARRLRRYHSSGCQADRCSAVQPDFSAGISAGRSPRPEHSAARALPPNNLVIEANHESRHRSHSRAQ